MIPVVTANQIKATDVNAIINWLLGLASDATVTAIAPGDLKYSATSTIPAGWLACTGQAVSRTGATANLFAAIGTTYGVGDGSTTFNVPDARGRTLVGAGTGAGLTARALAAIGGEETHLLSNGEMPNHNHTGITSTDSTYHWHTFTWTKTAATGYGSGTSYITAAGAYASGTVSASGTTDQNGPLHYHGIVADGGGGAHNNMQPFLVATVLIKI